MRIVLLPGLGADERLLGPQQTAFPELIVPPWLPPHREEGLPEYAGRLAQTLEVSPPLVIGGVSLGGMIAYEMARHLHPATVVLIASSRGRRQLRTRLPGVGGVLANLPTVAFDSAKWLASMGSHLLLGTNDEQRRLCVDMFCRADSVFMQWALGAILAWNPAPLAGVAVRQIHGERDRVIRADPQTDVLIPGGGHMINMTHAEIVNGFLHEALTT